MQHPREITVVGKIAAQENRGRGKGRDHAVAMGGRVFAADENIAGGQEDEFQSNGSGLGSGGDGVQRGGLDGCVVVFGNYESSHFKFPLNIG